MDHEIGDGLRQSLIPEVQVSEIDYLLNDPLILRILIDAYTALVPIKVPLDSNGFPQLPETRREFLQNRLDSAEQQPLKSRLIGDVTPDVYRLALKIVKTYETHFKG